MAKGSVYEVVSLLVMIGKRGCLTREAYRKHYGEADERAAIPDSSQHRPQYDNQSAGSVLSLSKG
jgi:hypothetical protein